ncbi:Dolichyl-diphosphooligosaccharide--protein glycosyltransferase subunit WBP1 [Pilobolus umbonatus]|nr:Dolichyl-diphosphooligosaccharide--protein glycosyltransferase subunit WBP1 [Pilobolus umbonatus]
MKGVYSIVLYAISWLTLFSTLTQALSVSGQHVLVVLDSLKDRDVYSHFWLQLRERDFELVFKESSDTSIPLFYFGESLYSHIIHFAPKSNALAHVQGFSNIQLVDYVNKGGNLIIAADLDATDNIRALVSEFDIELDVERVFSHTHFDQSQQDHSLIVTSSVEGPQTIVQKGSAPVLYSGVGLNVGSLPFSTAILTGESDAFISDSYSSKQNADKTVTLVAAFQARNSARVAVAGSLDLFSDKLMNAPVELSESETYPKSGNEEFIRQITEWVFQEKSVLKVVNHYHNKKGEFKQNDWYRVKDEVVYTIEITEYKEDEWVPYVAGDVQLELIMLDPYLRLTLDQIPAPHEPFGRFRREFRLPDVYGVFTFRVNYKRPGLTFISAEDQVSIRPFRHNEYPRFLTAAYPYYASTASMVLGFIVFSAIWLSTWNTRLGKSKTIKAKTN